MEDRFVNSKMFPLMNQEEDKKLTKLIELVKFVKDLDGVKKDMNIQLLLKELSKNPTNTAIQNALSEHLKFYVIKKNLKPQVFKIPPKE